MVQVDSGLAMDGAVGAKKRPARNLFSQIIPLLG